MSRPKTFYLDSMLPGEILKIPVLFGYNAEREYRAGVGAATMTASHARLAGVFGVSYIVQKSRLMNTDHQSIGQTIIKCSGAPDAHMMRIIDERMVRLAKLIRGKQSERQWDCTAIENIMKNMGPPPPIGTYEYRWPDGTRAYFFKSWYFRTLEMSDFAPAHDFLAIQDYSENIGVWPFEPDWQVSTPIPGFAYPWS